MAPRLHMRGRATVAGAPLFDADIAIPGGQWTCLLGPSGIGKSTILRLFAGLGDQVTFDGTYGADGGLDGRVALMAQDDLLMPWRDALSNVMLGAHLRGDRADRARALAVLAQVGLADKAGRKPRALSGGERQRVALARTLMEDREVVLLDEPFSALDARTRAQMQDLAAQVLAGRTVLLVTHDPAEAARLGDQILVMTEAGLDAVPPPPGAVPRRHDAPAVLQAQSALLNRLRQAA